MSTKRSSGPRWSAPFVLGVLLSSMIACEGTMEGRDGSISEVRDGSAPVGRDGSISVAPDGSAPPADSGPGLPDTGPPTCPSPVPWHRDLDEDGYGDPDASVQSCDPVPGFVENAGDCDDTCARCHPVGDETCDGADDDCDGAVDETQTCAAGAAVTCTTSCGSMGSGACSESCELPTGSSCSPPDETCNGADDDCDGTVDEGFACAAGSAAACTTTCGTTGTGACTASCEPASAEACEPPTEVCNGMDDDCDGARDDAFACALGEAVSCTTTCGTTGTGICTSSCELPAAAACAPPTEVCNGVDDDCDGTVDEGFACAAGSTAACTTTCGTTGAGVCTASCEPASAASCDPPEEVCNGVDDDCDGARDETFACTLGEAVSCTTTCGTTGAGTCTSSCEPPTGSSCNPPSEICNGRDDDCDGQPDDEFECVRHESLGCTTSCGSTGTTTCTSSCTAGSSCTPPAESCSYADDDCDGRVDEGGLRSLGAEVLTGPSYGQRRPRVVATNDRTYGLFRGSSSNSIYAFNDDGTVASRASSVAGTAEYDLAASANHVYYAYIDPYGDVQLQRVEGSPTSSDPFVWSSPLEIDLDAPITEVHLAATSLDVWVYVRANAGIEVHRVSSSKGYGGSFSVTSTTLDRPFAVASNGYRKHFVTWFDPDYQRVWFKQYDFADQELVRLFEPYLGGSPHDLAITGNYDITSVRGIVVAYSLEGVVRYYHYTSASQTDGPGRWLVTTAARGDQYSQLSLFMRQGVGYLAWVDDGGRIGLSQLVRRSSGTTLDVHPISTGALPARSHQGVSLALPRVPSSVADLSQVDRLFYDPGTQIASRPLSCN